MEKQTFTIPSISCGHCVATIQNELQELKGIVHVGGDPQTKYVTVEWQPPATASQIEDTSYPRLDIRCLHKIFECGCLENL